MAEITELETERLVLRQWAPTDLAPFAALNADPRVMEFFPARLTRGESDALAERCAALLSERGWGLWAAEFKATREFIGFVGLHCPLVELPFSPCVEIGWRLASAHWHQGLASEAARRVLRVGFDTLELPEIVSFTSVGNARSRAVMARIGLQDCGTFEHPQLPVGHPLRLHSLYRLARTARQRSDA
jgi:RimJ/RimL family protein N-acetyltransferase